MKKLLTILLLTIPYISAGQMTQPRKDPAMSKRPLTIIENKGQVTDQYGQTRHDIQSKATSNGVSVFIGNGQLHYQFHKAIAQDSPPALKGASRAILSGGRLPLGRGVNDTTPIQYQMYRLDMTLENANPHPTILPAEKQAYYENYHTTALNTDNEAPVAAYNKVTYKNIYPHIDWVLYIKNNQLEYDFIINPGGNVNDIKIKYSGADAITHTDSNIQVITPMGTVTERNLYAYNEATGKPIAANYTCKNNKLGFAVSSLRGTKQTTIVIDPSLAWGTYFGGIGEDGVFATTCDKIGNVVICGFTTSVSAIATTGAFETAYNGNEDIFLAKFNNSGIIQWATYYGGSSQDDGYAVCCDKAMDIYITGWTFSRNGISTSGCHQSVNMGAYDSYLAKFNSYGALQWGTYYGGTSDEMGKGVVSDTNNNVYITGYTGSDSNIATPGSFQDTIGGHLGGTNAYLAKFNTDGTLLKATYFGKGRYGSYALAYTINKNQEIYIGGVAYQDGIVTTPGTYQDSCSGAMDGFIAKFDSACIPLWSTYYGGDSGENVQNIACDNFLNIYITGNTNSLNGIATTGAHQTIYGGYISDGFLAKFNDTGILKWSTYYGGMWDDEGTGVTCDGLGNVYLTGCSQSPNNIATPGSYKDSNNNGYYDAFLAKFECTSGTLLWGTYYGGDLNDIAYGASCDNVGNVFIAGQTASSNGISTLGCYQYVFNDSSDAFLAKFDTVTTSNIQSIHPFVTHIEVFPDPNNGNFILSGEILQPSSYINIYIYNITGQRVYSDTAKIENGILYRRLNIGGVTGGKYILQVLSKSVNETVKFLI